MEIVQTEGERQVTREVEVYNLDAVIAVGYRVNSIKATHFRIWATNTLREFIVKAGDEYEKYRIQRDKEYLSDFDRELAKYLKGSDV